MRDIALRAGLLAIMKALTGVGEEGSDEGGCTADKKEACKIMYGQYFEATCAICPENPDEKEVTDGE
jgi:hypothetical protein